jgi:hypothetical protein
MEQVRSDPTGTISFVINDLASDKAVLIQPIK